MKQNAAHYLAIVFMTFFASQAMEVQKVDDQFNTNLSGNAHVWLHNERRHFISYYERSKDHICSSQVLLAGACNKNNLIKKRKLDVAELRKWCGQTIIELHEHKMTLEIRKNMRDRYMQAKSSTEKEIILSRFCRLFYLMDHRQNYFYFSFPLFSKIPLWYGEKKHDRFPWGYSNPKHFIVCYPDEGTERTVHDFLDHEIIYFQNKYDNLEKFSTRDLARMVQWLRFPGDWLDKKYSFIQCNAYGGYEPKECSAKLAECIWELWWLGYEAERLHIRILWTHELPLHKWRVVYNVPIAYNRNRGGIENKKPWYGEQITPQHSSSRAMYVCDTPKYIYKELDEKAEYPKFNKIVTYNPETREKKVVPYFAPFWVSDQNKAKIFKLFDDYQRSQTKSAEEKKELFDNLKSFAQKKCISLVNPQGDTLLHKALRANHEHAAHLIIYVAPHLLTYKNNMGQMPIHLAVGHNQELLAKMVSL
jgi:hypothetical protein